MKRFTIKALMLASLLSLILAITNCTSTSQMEEPVPEPSAKRSEQSPPQEETKASQPAGMGDDMERLD